MEGRGGHIWSCAAALINAHRMASASAFISLRKILNFGGLMIDWKKEISIACSFVRSVICSFFN